MCFNETSYKHHHFPWYCYVFFHGIWLVFMFFMLFHGSRFTIVNDAIFFAKSSGPMFLKFNDHRMQLFPMVVNHRPTDVMIAMYRSTPDLLSSCQQAVSNINIKISNKMRDLQVDIINSQSHFTQVSPALCEVVP